MFNERQAMTSCSVACLILSLFNPKSRALFKISYLVTTDSSFLQSCQVSIVKPSTCYISEVLHTNRYLANTFKCHNLIEVSSVKYCRLSSYK